MPPDPMCVVISVCEFGADHSGNEIWLRILPDNADLNHLLELQQELQRGKRCKRISVSVIPRNRTYAGFDERSRRSVPLSFWVKAIVKGPQVENPQ
jgi:hypothetical protein